MHDRDRNGIVSLCEPLVLPIDSWSKWCVVECEHRWPTGQQRSTTNSRWVQHNMIHACTTVRINLYRSFLCAMSFEYFTLHDYEAQVNLCQEFNYLLQCLLEWKQSRLRKQFLLAGVQQLHTQSEFLHSQWCWRYCQWTWLEAPLRLLQQDIQQFYLNSYSKLMR